MDRRLRKILKKFGKEKLQYRKDNLVSIYDDWRITYLKDDSEGLVKRRVLYTDGETDEEIYNWLWENVAVEIRSQYDCTGQLFTEWFTVVHIKGTDRVIVIHRMGLDV